MSFVPHLLTDGRQCVVIAPRTRVKRVDRFRTPLLALRPAVAANGTFTKPIAFVGAIFDSRPRILIQDIELPFVFCAPVGIDTIATVTLEHMIALWAYPFR
jgi:predicted methyltransferase MtxX (methanogen marker protein 4)